MELSKSPNVESVCDEIEDDIEDFTPTEVRPPPCTEIQRYVPTQWSQAPIEEESANNECVMDYSSEFVNNEIFSSRDGLIEWVREIGKRNGFVIVTLCSDNELGGRAPRLSLGCERGDKYRDRRKNKDNPVKEGKGRQTGTKKCECPFFHLSKHQCITYLPHRSPPSTSLRKEIAMAFVNGNHFVQVFLVPGHPVPPITPYWHKWRFETAKEWEGIFLNRVQRWKDIVPASVITSDVIVEL